MWLDVRRVPAICVSTLVVLGPHPSVALDELEPGPLDSARPHYYTTRENQRHIPGTDLESLTTL